MTTMQQLTEQVAAENRLPIKEIMGPGRRRDIAWTRQEIMRRCYDDLGKTEPQIAAFLKMDASTVHYGIKRARERRA